MSIRYRLLLIVGLVSSLIFLSTFFFENAVLMKNFKKIQKEVLDVYRQSIEKKRESLEVLASNFLAQQLAQTNSLLGAISKFPALAEWFAPTEENIQKGTWNNAATLLENDDWIDFLQNTFDHKLLSLIVPDPGPFSKIHSEPIEEGLAWVFMLESSSKAFLGIELPVRAGDSDLEEPSSFLASGILPTVHVLYDLEKFKELDFSDSSKTSFETSFRVPLMQGYELDEEKFFAYLDRATDLAKNPEFKPPEQKKSLDKPEESALSLESQFQQDTANYLDSMIEYSSELFLIWEVTALHHLSVFGKEMGGPKWPDAISFSEQGSHQGSSFFLKPVLGFSKPLFDDQAFFDAHPPKEGSFIASGSAVIKSPHPNEAFLVNTAAICLNAQKGQPQSLLTIGFDLSDLLYDATTSLGLYTYIVSGEEILIEMIPEDLPVLDKGLLSSAFSKEIGSVLGLVLVSGSEYYFLKVQPDPSLDLHFFFLQPKKSALAILQMAQEKISHSMKQMKFQRIGIELFGIFILWILLMDLSKKITNPIVLLSASLKLVKEGDWDHLKPPSIRLHKNNEIKQLWDSFYDMVKGLKEKERMSGILNKVVSKEIANEILKGDILLGGEEKVVTMLFVDIRGFTKMTQNMAPHEVIALLNTCMTKLSKAVENNKGVIDKYLGDGFMALYGAPITYKDCALYSVLSGLEMLDIMKKWNEERILQGLVSISIGIGVHMGAVCAGNMGAQNRLNYTVIGSPVNLASRLCFAAGPGELLITADTYLDPSVQQTVEVEDKGFVSLKGFDEKKQVYKVLRLKEKA